jgi:very-short-patch-repair endonuclease
MNPKLSFLAEQRGGWFTRADAMLAGYSQSELQRRLAGGRWARLCRDAYVEPGCWPADELPWERTRRLHLMVAGAVVHRMGEDVVISHQSATLLHGLPGWGLNFDRVQVTRTAGRVRSDSAMQTHRSPLAPGDITRALGLPCTSPARSVVEAVCASSYEVGVVLSDAALHDGLVTKEQLTAMADRLQCWPGSPKARAAARFADGRVESVGESRLRVLMANEGLPDPELQVEIRDQSGRLVGRVDFLLARRLIVEFDGDQKYGTDPANAVLAEKRRENRLRELGYSLIRVDWKDLDHSRPTGIRLHQALATRAA